jgi:hypothetical protein
MLEFFSEFFQMENFDLHAELVTAAGNGTPHARQRQRRGWAFSIQQVFPQTTLYHQLECFTDDPIILDLCMVTLPSSVRAIWCKKRGTAVVCPPTTMCFNSTLSLNPSKELPQTPLRRFSKRRKKKYFRAVTVIAAMKVVSPNMSPKGPLNHT